VIRSLVPALLLVAVCSGSVIGADTDALLAQLDRELAALATKNPAQQLVQQGRAAADAKEIPAQAPKEQAETLGLPTTGGGDPNAELATIISGLGLNNGFNERSGQVILVTTGFAQVQGKPGTAAWANSRAIAYNTAELRARAALVGTLSETVLSGRNVTVLENSGAITDPTAPKPVSRDAITKQAQTTAEAELDANLAKLGVPPEQYRDLPPERKRLLLSEAYEAYVKVAASRAMAGCATLAVVEGPVEGNQGMAVAVVWSESLAKLSTVFATYGGMLPPKPAAVGKRLADQIPSEPDRLLRCFGVQRAVDETGETTLIAYAQAGLADVNPAMRATALANAYDKARLEATAALKAFIYEQTSTQAQRELAQLAAITVGEQSKVQEATLQQLDNYQRTIRSGSDTAVTLVGVSEAKRWSGRVDGASVAGIVLQWSPRNQRLAVKAATTNDHAAERNREGKAPAAGGGGVNNTDSSGASTTFDPSK
jgi:hypothetical protein